MQENISSKGDLGKLQHVWGKLSVNLPSDIPNERVVVLLWNIQRTDEPDQTADENGRRLDAKKSDVLQGTLDLMILKTLYARGPLHGFGIARRLEQVSRDVLRLNEGTVYTSLLRLQQQGWITAE